MKTTDSLFQAFSPGRFEIWTLGGLPSVKIVKPAIVEQSAEYTPSASGLVAIRRDRSGSIFDVFDLKTGLGKASFPPESERTHNVRRPAPYGPHLSSNGRTLLALNPLSLWEVESGKVLWKGEDDQWPNVSVRENSFSVHEPWSIPLTKWFGTRAWFSSLNTTAWRNLETGRLEFRTWAMSNRTAAQTSPDGSLSIGRDGAVNQMPYRVHWIRLALCQIVLASPLVLCWALLGWRRRRKARTAA
jgi:hypothetical protein